MEFPAGLRIRERPFPSSGLVHCFRQNFGKRRPRTSDSVKYSFAILLSSFPFDSFHRCFDFPANAVAGLRKRSRKGFSDGSGPVDSLSPEDIDSGNNGRREHKQRESGLADNPSPALMFDWCNFPVNLSKWRRAKSASSKNGANSPLRPPRKRRRQSRGNARSFPDPGIDSRGSFSGRYTRGKCRKRRRSSTLGKKDF